MKEFKNVRGTMAEVLLLEINVDTIYIRSNVIRIDEEGEEGFHGWQYDEIQMTKNEYIASLQDSIDVLILSNL